MVAFRMDPAVVIQLGGASAGYDLVAPAGRAFAIVLDLDGGPADVLGERFYLGLTPSLVSIQSGLVPPGGIVSRQLQCPAAAVPRRPGEP